ncbi:MAG: formylglycine-generating enzyme family protein [Amaricoccus sp.]
MTCCAPLSLAGADPRDGMVRLAGGAFTMGSDAFYREERPARPARVDPFWIDPTPVTNADFARFVALTGYVTVAERPPRREDYPDADSALLVPGSLVFVQPGRPVSLRDPRAWWAYLPGADWRHPQGPGSSLAGLDDHPVVQVAWEDARAYAAWAGKALPTEAEWEFAAKGGRDGIYPWGDELAPGGRHMANTWQGRFPFENTGEDGFDRTSPVRAFPPNGYGLFDMAGNAWEWTVTPYAAGGATPSCCQAGAGVRQRVVKGGSHLCAPAHCHRFRPAARQGEDVDTGTSHIGFRCVIRD